MYLGNKLAQNKVFNEYSITMYMVTFTILLSSFYLHIIEHIFIYLKQTGAIIYS